MTGNWEIAHLEMPDRWFAYAEAYLNAGIAVCNYMTSEEENRTWPNASVAMLMTAHSVELFLKAAILSRNPQHELIHNLEQLKATYDEIFPEERFNWQLPFHMEYLGLSEEEIATLRKEQPEPSIRFRYPANRRGTPWEGIHGFTPEGFRGLLMTIQDDYERLWEEIKNI